MHVLDSEHHISDFNIWNRLNPTKVIGMLFMVIYKALYYFLIYASIRN